MFRWILSASTLGAHPTLGSTVEKARPRLDGPLEVATLAIIGNACLHRPEEQTQSLMYSEATGSHISIEIVAGNRDRTLPISVCVTVKKCLTRKRSAIMIATVVHVFILTAFMGF